VGPPHGTRIRASIFGSVPAEAYVRVMELHTRRHSKRIGVGMSLRWQTWTVEHRLFSTMPITMQHERDNIYRIDISGLLEKDEFDRCQSLLVDEMRRIGPVKLLFVLSRFEGWERSDAWGDLTFYVVHGDTIERIAVVGDDKWRGEALMFAAADLRRAPVEFFSSADALTEAHAWLAA